MWAEFHHFVGRLAPTETDQVSVLFAFAWGFAVYGDRKNWCYLRLTPSALYAKVQDLEQQEEGHIGNSDLFLLPEDKSFQIQLCHESDVHIIFDKPSDFTANEKARWQELGYVPCEWTKKGNKWVEPSGGAYVSSTAGDPSAHP
ncbi:MAG: hypothetical protein A2340_13020 [Lentisphaerae bacterium RIFOXYB12_FULL_60_10]|nr:MAG: hypothetical protein A2340_13020 [Lentisphaerae bacterium RIFOXYB12_FULL_60_10]